MRLAEILEWAPTATLSAIDIPGQLIGGREEENLEIPRDGAMDRFGERANFFRKLPAINGDREDLCSAFCESFVQRKAHSPVFLDGDSLTSQPIRRAVGIDRSEQFFPGIRFRCSKIDMDTDFTHHDRRFGAAQSDDATVESGKPLFSRETRFPDFEQGFGTNACQKENDVDLASEELLGKF